MRNDTIIICDYILKILLKLSERILGTNCHSSFQNEDTHQFQISTPKYLCCLQVNGVLFRKKKKKEYRDLVA